MRRDLPLLDEAPRRTGARAPSSEAAAAPDYGRIIPRLQAFYGGDPEAWFNTPGWVLTAYMDMLPQLHAERQLSAIEAAFVPSMTPANRQALVQRLARRIEGRPQTRARSLHEALGPHARRVEVPRGAKK